MNLTLTGYWELPISTFFILCEMFLYVRTEVCQIQLYQTKKMSLAKIMQYVGSYQLTDTPLSLIIVTRTLRPVTKSFRGGRPNSDVFSLA